MCVRAGHARGGGVWRGTCQIAHCRGRDRREHCAKCWRPVAESMGWPVVIRTDDSTRGGKLVTFVLHLIDDTDLVADSIGNYVWGLRWFMKLQHQAEPVFGVMHWHDFMTSMRVVAHVPHEPRRALSLALIEAMAETVDLDAFDEVQFIFFWSCSCSPSHVLSVRARRISLGRSRGMVISTGWCVTSRSVRFRANGCWPCGSKRLSRIRGLSAQLPVAMALIEVLHSGVARIGPRWVTLPIRF